MTDWRFSWKTVNMSLVYRINDPKVAFLLFSSGRVVCAGAKSLEDIKRAVGILEKKLASLGK